MKVNQDFRIFKMYYERFDPATPPSRENSARQPQIYKVQRYLCFFDRERQGERKRERLRNRECMFEVTEKV